MTSQKPIIDNPQGIPMMPAPFTPNAVRGCSYNYRYRSFKKRVENGLTCLVNLVTPLFANFSRGIRC